MGGGAYIKTERAKKQEEIQTSRSEIHMSPLKI